MTDAVTKPERRIGGLPGTGIAVPGGSSTRSNVGITAYRLSDSRLRIDVERPPGVGARPPLREDRKRNTTELTMDFDGAAAEWVRRNYNSDVIVGSVEFDLDMMAYASGPCYADIDVTWRENTTVRGPSYRLSGGGSFRPEKRVVKERHATVCGRGDTDGRKDYDITMLIREIVAIATEHNDAV